MGPEMKELGVVQPASPCSVAWSAMQGDACRRLCHTCKRHVYSFTGLSADDARLRLEPLTMRFWARSDGTLLTKDCPAGRARKRRRRVVVVALSAALAALIGWLAYPRPAPAPVVYIGGPKTMKHFCGCGNGVY